jgi:hypothetical protein
MISTQLAEKSTIETLINKGIKNMEYVISSINPLLKTVLAAPPTAQVTAVAIVALVVAVVALVSMVSVVRALRGGADPN